MFLFAVVRAGRERDAALFSDLHRKLQSHGHVVTNRWAVLYLLLKLSDAKQPNVRPLLSIHAVSGETPAEAAMFETKTRTLGSRWSRGR